MWTERLLMYSCGVVAPRSVSYLNANATDILSALAVAVPSAWRYGKEVCFTVTLRFLKCALMSQALTRSSSSSPMVEVPPKVMYTFSFLNEKSEKLMLLISQSQPSSVPASFSMCSAGRIFRMNSRQVSLSLLMSASLASALVRAPSAPFSISSGSMPLIFLSRSRSRSSFSRCSITFATVLLAWIPPNCVSSDSPWLTRSAAPFTTLSSSRLFTIAVFQDWASWLCPVACASRSLRIGRGMSMLRSPSATRMPW
mmetsp:Transcript_97995/g.277775  ORF Transcript_97995/g.277775 Transcript_97995/m.277775 type:complete len:255 (-) Transcript_97995:1489-2253(-)